jgi:hypothetical protein
MTPEEGAFYYDARRNTLVYCSDNSLVLGRVVLDKVNVEDSYASCPLEYFQANYKKVAFLVNEEESK